MTRFQGACCGKTASTISRRHSDTEHGDGVVPGTRVPRQSGVNGIGHERFYATIDSSRLRY